MTNINKNEMYKNFEDLYKFRLKEFTKFPSGEWTLDNQKKHKKDAHLDKKCNWGLPCGIKNNIFLFDLDTYKWTDTHPFMVSIKSKGFDNLENYLNSLDTCIIKTAHDGYHVYFEYDKRLNKNTSFLNIDIKSNRGYGVGVGSHIKKQKDKCPDEEIGKIGYYRIFKNNKIGKCPDDLIDWILESSILAKDINKVDTKTEPTKKEKSIYKNTTDLINNNFDNLDYHLKRTYNKKIWTDYNSWLLATTAFKSLDKKELWIELSKQNNNEKFDYDKNLTTWNGIKKTGMSFINGYFKLMKEEDLFKMIRYKSTIDYSNLNNGITNNYEKINRTKLGKIKTFKEDAGFVELTKYDDIIIKSDTGTGKTTLVIDYMRENKENTILSIVSRCSLANAHYNEFLKKDITIYNYQLCHERYFTSNKQNLIICADSLLRLYKLDFTNKIVFLDEFDSLIKHIINSPTIKKRVQIWNLFRKILKKCKKIICVDADITSSRIQILNNLGRKFSIIENTFKHNKDKFNGKGIKMTESLNDIDFMNLIHNHPSKRKLICCDSKKQSEVIFDEIIKKNKCEFVEKLDEELYNINIIAKTVYKDSEGLTYALITSDSDDVDSLDDFDIVVFSPKIIYGLDSLMERPVFASYKELTINPKSMLQQICRCRNITDLTFIFYKKAFVGPLYNNLKTVEKNVNQYENLMVDFETSGLQEDECNLYKKILKELIFEDDCYNSNKYIHFKKLAEKKGFYQLDKTHVKTENLELKIKEKEIIQEKIDTFDINYYSKVNDILDLSNEDAKEYAELYVEPHKLTYYLNRVSFFHKNRNRQEWKIKEKDDFKILKAQSTENKILFITDFINTYSTNKSKIDFESLTNKTNDNINKLTFDTFKVLFRYRGNPLDLSIINNRIKCIKKMYIELFGKDFINTKKVKVNNKTVNKWFIDKDILLNTVLLLEKHQDNLFDFNDDLKYIIGEENNMLKVKTICKIKDDDDEENEIDTLEKRKGEIYKYFKRINI